jgi:RNA polymerase-binding transcription factor DksA
MAASTTHDSARQRLTGRARTLREYIHHELLTAEDKSLVAIADQVHDRGEEAIADQLADMQIATLTREVAELADVEAALRRIAEGRYGRCIDCNAEIPAARLAAYPTAKRCTACQRKREQRNAAPPRL